jgi:hypothetical protein
MLPYRLSGWVLVALGSKWAIPSLDDLGIFAGPLSVFSFVSNPVVNAYSRHLEHQADQHAAFGSGRSAYFTSRICKVVK